MAYSSRIPVRIPIGKADDRMLKVVTLAETEPVNFKYDDPVDLPETEPVTGKSLSESLNLASTNPQYDKRLFIDLPAQ